mgnify:FL=1
MTLSQVPERTIRYVTAILVPGFASVCLIAMFSSDGPATICRRTIALLVCVTTIPVGIAIARMHFGKAWRPQSVKRVRSSVTAIVIYADLGLTVILFTFVDPEAALFGTAMFAIIGTLTATFTGRVIVIGHMTFTTAVITTLAILTWREGTHDTAAVLARWATAMLATNATLLALNGFTRGVQAALDTQLVNATRDPLTGLLNRRGLELWVNRSLRSQPASLDFILIDLDNFKRINDTHGHRTGDNVLVAAANRLTARLANGGLLARTGGEEFAVLITTSEPGELAEAMRAAVYEPTDPVRVTASVGVATLTREEIRGDAVPALIEGLRRADIALYEAKRAGRNCVRWYSDTMDEDHDPPFPPDTGRTRRRR